MNVQKIVTIGGGTGHFQVLRGLKNYECELSAIVNTSDNGGSSGKLRDEYGILPPGDIRQCMVALAPEDESKILRKLFNYRFKDGHNLGNLIITAASEILGGLVPGIKATEKLLGIEGKVLPVSIDDCQLVAETLEGKILRGEMEINSPCDKKDIIKNIWHEPKAFLYKETASEIRSADKVIICPGDLYGSIIPNLIVEGMSSVLSESRAMRVYICNLFTKEGTYNFKARDFVKEIEKYAQVKMDRIIINVGKPGEEIVEKYFSENSKLVEDDLKGDKSVVRGEFAAEYSSEPKTILRHIPEKIAHAIIGLR